nr:MAG TPA: hypothetical protein [Caudoviricetes sp.]
MSFIIVTSFAHVSCIPSYYYYFFYCQHIT